MKLVQITTIGSYPKGAVSDVKKKQYLYMGVVDFPNNDHHISCTHMIYP